MLFVTKFVRRVLFIVFVTVACRTIQGQTSPFPPLDGKPPAANPQPEFPGLTPLGSEPAAKLKLRPRKFPTLKLMELKRPALTDEQLRADPLDDEVTAITKQKAATLRALVNVYRDKLSHGGGEVPQLLDVIAKTERKYTDSAFEILKSSEDKLNALYHNLNAAIYYENFAAERSAVGGPPEAYFDARVQRLDAQLRIAKFTRTMAASPRP